MDNGKPFSAALVTQFCNKLGIKQRFSTMYNATANGLTEAFNKTLCKLLEKIVSKSKRYWHERLDEALWAYRTSYRITTNATPFALVYGVEVVLPLERQMNSLRMAIQDGITEDENSKL
ncbi:PREDICTED: uncharacterized protein LOC104596916 [Nelumbo nucifera]|uniref:Uncharacterized protein LOC104596916 n=1 Tax=Nelumbo nucifera TaxID=4432 RepID=A0A1U8A460_NELNU|nr:PREDICTED: uncharacterized protein LOC104596916 [Nelumbo nucifera]